MQRKKGDASKSAVYMPRVDIAADASKIGQYTIGDLRALVEAYLKFEKEANEAYKVNMKELESSHLKNAELSSRMEILSTTLNDALIVNERLTAANDVNMTMQDYAASVCKIWFGDPCSVENWCRKNTKVFDGIKDQVGDLAIKIGNWQLDDKESTNGFLKALVKEVNDIDETITSNLELVSDHIDKIESTVNGLVKDFKERFTDKEKKFEKRVIPVTYDKLQELTANSAAFKIKSKELAEKDKKYTKQITTLEEECANLKDLLEHLEKKNSQLNAQADSSKKALQDFERNSARTDELEGLAQSYSLMKQRAEELEKKTSSQDIELKELRSTMSVYSEQAKKLRVQLAEETTKLENALKQEQLAHEQSKKDLASLEERDKENEEFLIKDAKKSKRLNEELVQTKEKLKYQEAELQKTVELLKKFTQENADLKHAEKLSKSMASTPELRSQTKPQVKAKVSGKKVSIFDSDIGQEKDIQREDKIKAMELQVKELQVKIDQLEVALQRKDEESEEIKQLYEKSASQIQQLQDEQIDLSKKNKILKDKREYGIKEIERLKEKIRSIKEQHKIEIQSLRNSREGSDLETSMSTVDGYRMTDMSMQITEEDLGITNDFLMESYQDLQQIYKTVVMLIPLLENEKNKSLISAEGRLNSLISKVCDRIQ